MFYFIMGLFLLILLSYALLLKALLKPLTKNSSLENKVKKLATVQKRKIEPVFESSDWETGELLRHK